MKAIVKITIDMDTGAYTLDFGTSKKGEKIEQEELAKTMQKVLDNWKLKFCD